MVSGDPNTIGSFGELPDDDCGSCGECEHYHPNRRFWTTKKHKREYGLCDRQRIIVYEKDDGCDDTTYDHSDREGYDDR